MKAHEILVLARPMIEKLAHAGISPKDIQHLSLYDDFSRLKGEGHKITYIEAYICEEYNIKRTRFYDIIRKFDTDL